VPDTAHIARGLRSRLLRADPAPAAGTNATVNPSFHNWTMVYLGLYPIVTFQYSSTTLYQVSYHTKVYYLFF
jgi:hypothetical protein